MACFLVPSTQCRIQKCTTDFVSLTTHLTPTLDGFDAEFCKALRAYSACTQRTAKSCRGNLVFHSAVLGISDLMTQRNCSRDGPTSSTHPEVPHEPCSYDSRIQHAHAQARGHGQAHAHGHAHPRPGYLFCGLFGDPHLRTFKDSFQTCKVEGAWPLIDNDYLSVQVTNVPVVTGSSATATNKRSPGRHVELHAGYIGVRLIVRQLGRYLTMAVRIPEEMAEAYDASQDLQLCLNGCPSSERIDRGGHLALPPLSPPALGLQQPSSSRRGVGTPLPRASPYGAPRVLDVREARERCHEELEVPDIYFHSCVFDLLTTGDTNFTAAAASAQKDMESLHPHRDHWRIYPRDSAPPAASQPIARLALLLLCSALCSLALV
ncbi:hypothetical protein CRUP_009207 [Coryphaenoides rupestris]|nr:hypothetical protein CRUP_009207 [Coryphaenoides rupestris]